MSPYCCCTGGTVAVFVSPLEVLKTRLQTQARGQGAKYVGGIHIYGTHAACCFVCCSRSSLHAKQPQSPQTATAWSAHILHKPVWLLCSNIMTHANLVQAVSSRLWQRRAFEGFTEAWDLSLWHCFPIGRSVTLASEHVSFTMHAAIDNLSRPTLGLLRFNHCCIIWP